MFEANLSSSQFAYRDGCNCTDALLKLQYNCLKALDDTETNAVRLYVRHFLLSLKLKALNLNPYLINWFLSFLKTGSRFSFLEVKCLVTPTSYLPAPLERRLSLFRLCLKKYIYNCRCFERKPNILELQKKGTIILQWNMENVLLTTVAPLSPVTRFLFFFCSFYFHFVSLSQ